MKLIATLMTVGLVGCGAFHGPQIHHQSPLQSIGISTQWTDVQFPQLLDPK